MSALKGFTSLFKSLTSRYNGEDSRLEQLFTTLQLLGSGKVGLHTAPRWLSSVSTGNTLDAAGSSKTVLAITGHSIRKNDVIRFTSGNNAGEEVQVIDNSDADSVLIGQKLPNTPSGSDGFTLLRAMSPTLDSSGQVAVVEGITTIVDFLDAGSYEPSSGGDGIIPRSSNDPVEVVNSLAQSTTKLQVIQDVGEFINLYKSDGAGGFELLAHFPLTPDVIVDVDIDVGETLYLGAAKDSDIDVPGTIIEINFIG